MIELSTGIVPVRKLQETDMAERDSQLLKTGSKDEQHRDRCAQFTSFLLDRASKISDFGELVRTSPNYEHFRVALVCQLASTSRVASEVALRWRKYAHTHRTSAPTEQIAANKSSVPQFAFEDESQKTTGDSFHTSAIPAAALQRKLLAALACPITRGPVEVLPTVLAADAIREGVIVSRQLGRVIGCIRNFKIDFIRFPDWRDLSHLRAEGLAGNLPQRQTTEQVAHFEDAFSDFFRFTGDWRRLEDQMLVTDCITGRSSIHFSCSGPAIIHFGAHPWSSIVQVFLNDSLFAIIDLFEPHTTVPRDVSIPIDALLGGETLVEVRSIGDANTLSMGRQCLFIGCSVFTETQIPIVYEKKSLVRGAKFDKRFYD